ncbi:hypothetical protein D3C71_1716860 [compost metagenome]
MLNSPKCATVKLVERSVGGSLAKVLARNGNSIKIAAMTEFFDGGFEQSIPVGGSQLCDSPFQCKHAYGEMLSICLLACKSMGEIKAFPDQVVTSLVAERN